MRDTIARADESPSAPILLADRLPRSQLFAELFRDGMALIEETAAYLDGPGRADAAALGRSAAVAFTAESVRLTTRLMQAASWLMLHRAVADGDMTLAEAAQEKAKICLDAGRRSAARADLPAGFLALIERSTALVERIVRLDRRLSTPVRRLSVNPVALQIATLEAAFSEAS